MPMSRKIYFDVALFVASVAAGYYSYNILTEALNPDSKRAKLLRSNGTRILSSLNKSHLQLDELEAQLASEIILPPSLDSSANPKVEQPSQTRFSTIGGLDHIISDLRESIILPLRYPSLLAQSHSALLSGPPRGVLLYGPPGCGKTLLARALAHEAGATFINIRISSLSSKWFGESTKLISALFSLAKKCEPSIIFIDEIDAFLRVRNSGDHEASAGMKAEFMTLWDGLLSSTSRILVLGATNRPNDIDSAILRRMPKRFHVPLPDWQARVEILRIFLSPLPPSLDISLLAGKTRGLSGSDLKELCRNAVMKPVREFLRSQSSEFDTALLDPSSEAEMNEELADLSSRLRPVRIEDFDVDALNLNLERSREFENGEWEVGGDGGVPGGLD